MHLEGHSHWFHSPCGVKTLSYVHFGAPPSMKRGDGTRQECKDPRDTTVATNGQYKAVTATTTVELVAGDLPRGGTWLMCYQAPQPTQF